MNIKIFTDGGSRGNPGNAAIGYVILNRDEVIYKYAEPIGIATNNIAEYKAVLFAMKKAGSMGAENIELFLDSQLVEKQLKGEYKVKSEELLPLYNAVILELRKFRKVEITHVKREKNKEADRLVNLALDSNSTVEESYGLEIDKDGKNGFSQTNSDEDINESQDIKTVLENKLKKENIVCKKIVIDDGKFLFVSDIENFKKLADYMTTEFYSYMKKNGANRVFFEIKE